MSTRPKDSEKRGPTSDYIVGVCRVRLRLSAKLQQM